MSVHETRRLPTDQIDDVQLLKGCSHSDCMCPSLIASCYVCCWPKRRAGSQPARRPARRSRRLRAPLVRHWHSNWCAGIGARQPADADGVGQLDPRLVGKRGPSRR